MCNRAEIINERQSILSAMQDDGMNKEPRNDQEPGDSSLLFVGCQTDLTLADLNELEAALAKKGS